MEYGLFGVGSENIGNVIFELPRMKHLHTYQFPDANSPDYFERWEKYLDKARWSRLGVLVSIPEAQVLSGGGVAAVRIVDRVKDNPNVIGYYLFDEPEGKIPPEALRVLYNMIKAKDPDRDIVIAMQKPWTWIFRNRFREACDIVATDFYPVPFFPKWIIWVLNKLVQRQGKRVWTIIQAHNVSNYLKARVLGRYPSKKAMKRMVWYARKSGAEKIFFFEGSGPTRRWPGLWNQQLQGDIKQLDAIREITNG